MATRKHIETTVIWLKRRFKGEFQLAEKSDSPRLEVFPNGEGLSIERIFNLLPKSLRPLFDLDGRLLEEDDAIVK